MRRVRRDIGSLQVLVACHCPRDVGFAILRLARRFDLETCALGFAVKQDIIHRRIYLTDPGKQRSSNMSEYQERTTLATPSCYAINDRKPEP